MKYYYAQFIQSQNKVEVVFPDLPACVTFGDTWDEAYENAVDVLAGWLANAEPQFIKKPSRHEDFKHLDAPLVPIPVNSTIMQSYEQVKRFNVIFPVSVLRKVDAYRKTTGLKRSTLLRHAVEEYISHHTHDNNTPATETVE